MRHPQLALSSIIRGSAAIFATWFCLAAIPANAASGVHLCETPEDSSAGLRLRANKLADTLSDALADQLAETLSTKFADKDAEVGDGNAPASAIAVTIGQTQSPRLRESMAEVADASEPAADTDSADLPGPESRFPGVSDDQASRYRRQMYRTDI